MTTPMFQQYHQLKESHPDAILFFRMGDFYEVFFDDAKIASKVLDITLTSRNRNEPNPIPMAGVPHHSATSYVQKLTDEGYRVAIAEQVEDAAASKGLVKREIVKVVTPGIVLDSSLLDANTGVFVVGVCMDGSAWGLAFFDVSTGDLKVTQVETPEQVVAEISRIQPKEALVSRDALASPVLADALESAQIMLSNIEDEAWDPREANRELAETLNVRDLSGFDLEDMPLGACAAGAVVRYARTYSGGVLANLHEIRTYRTHKFMVLDETTHRNLEITKTLIGGQRKGSLIWLLDDTSTAMGSRMLREWLSFPLMDVEMIRARQDAVEAFIQLGHARETFSSALKEVADVERITCRITQGTGSPRDLAGLRRSLSAIPSALASLHGIAALADWIPQDLCEDCRSDLESWLVDDPPISVSDGGMIRKGNSDELDELIAISVEGVRLIHALEAKEKAETGIGNLKIRRNRMFGYYIEVTRSHLHKVPEDRYLRKQTLTNAERYITVELKELEDKVLGADERRKSLEYSLFCDLRERVASNSERLGRLARSLAQLDTLANLAEMATQWRWSRPTISAEPKTSILEGRHPVVEALLREERYVPNDVHVSTDERKLIILTGPNMSGKSTVMRQVAIITLLAQIGSFVPAQSADVGLTDRIFTRVGAADNLSQGQSTFMVEMAETASILHNATARSLVVLDEIGRGTSTYDGLAIAWAVAEDIVTRIGCRAFFATHYHEMCRLADEHQGVVNQSVAVSERDGRIVFLRALQNGGANRSYGVQCAKLAGLPDAVVQRALGLLELFERNAPRDVHNQLSLFGDARPTESQPLEQEVHPVVDALRKVDPDSLSPREALEALYEIKELL